MRLILSELCDAFKELLKALTAVLRELASLTELHKPYLSGNHVWAKENRKAIRAMCFLIVCPVVLALILAGLNVGVFVAWMEYLLTGTNAFWFLMLLAGVQALVVTSIIAFLAWLWWSL